jgi:hypothetical protein
MKKLIIGIAIVAIIAIVSVVQYYQSYHIQDSPEAIEKEIEHRLRADIEIRSIQTMNNKLVFAFTMGTTLGSGELIKGFNGRYKYYYAGYGTNEIRERIIETQNGQFLMLTGRNNLSIKHITAFIEDESYDVIIPEGEYYLTLTPVKETLIEYGQDIH